MQRLLTSSTHLETNIKIMVYKDKSVMQHEMYAYNIDNNQRYTHCIIGSVKFHKVLIKLWH
jgi:hypothetical protein